MANEFIIKNGFHSKGDSQITGSLNVKDSLTVNGSAVGAAFPFTGDAQITGSLIVSGAAEFRGVEDFDTNVVIGKDATSTGQYSVVIGKDAGISSGGGEYVVIGHSANLANNALYNVVIGEGAYGSGNGSVAIGEEATAAGEGIAIGRGANVSDYRGIAIGKGITSGLDQLSIGNSANGTLISASLSTGHVILSGSIGGLELIGSGSTVFSVIGSEGDLFTVTDNLTSGSLFAVKDLSGFPLLDVNKKHDGTPDLVTVGQSDLVIDSGSILISGSINLTAGSISVSSSLLVTGSAVNSLYSKASEFTSIWNVYSGGGQYEFTGPGLAGENVHQPVLYLTRGEKYKFQLNATNHPFYFQTIDGDYSSGYVYSNGVQGGGTEVGEVTFNVPFDAPTRLYYVCENHGGMGNAVYIQNPINSSGSFSGSFTGDGTNLDLASNTTIPASNPFPISASSAQIISRSFASGHTDSTALRLFGSGSVSESGIFEVKGSVGPLFSVADGLDGILMEVNDISGLPLLQVSSSGIVRTPVGITSQRPVVTFGTNFTASSAYEGYYFRVGGEITCSIQADTLPTVNAEFDFFQTSSAGNLLFETGSTSVIVNSKNGNLNLAGQFSSATLKYIGNNTFDLMGDLT